MKKLISVGIAGIGYSVPPKVLTNRDLEKMVETSEEWIVTRTGIRERRVAAEGDATSRWAVEAARKALGDAKVAPEELDLIITATVTPDYLMPSCACLVQKELGASKAACFDLGAACAGFIYALSVGTQYVRSGSAQTVLVIAADQISSFVDWKDRATCVLFGDAAGACVLRGTDRRGIIDTQLGADGRSENIIKIPAGGSLRPASAATLAERAHCLRMDGQEVFKQAVRIFVQSTRRILEKNAVKIEDLRCFIPHQANIRILNAVASRLGLSEEQLFVNLDRYGNTTAAAVAVALCEAVQTRRVKRGDLLLLSSVGAGLVWGSALLEW